MIFCMDIQPKVGRPPKRAPDDSHVTLTIRIPGGVKNLMIDMSDAYDMTITEYLIALVNRDAAS